MVNTSALEADARKALVGSSPTTPTNAVLAQLVEHRSCKAEVLGSSPRGGSIRTYGEMVITAPCHGAVSSSILGTSAK